MTIFNRSHYEDVLIARVHNLVPKEIWSRRYDRINAFESGLVEGDTHILKFFLHISKGEQLKRFKDRLDDPAKQWKISEADYKERTYWDDYTAAYEDALSRCSTEHAPWFVIPSDHKWFRNLAVARIVVEHMEGLEMKFPRPRWTSIIFAMSTIRRKNTVADLGAFHDAFKPSRSPRTQQKGEWIMKRREPMGLPTAVAGGLAVVSSGESKAEGMGSIGRRPGLKSCFYCMRICDETFRHCYTLVFDGSRGHKRR